MKDISADTQVVLDAIKATYEVDELSYPTDEQIAAAVLRATVDQLVPDEPDPGLSQFWDDEADREWQNNQHFRRKFLAIANELENI